MKLGLFALAATVLAVASGTASAQPVVIQPAPVVVASPSPVVGFGFGGRGFSVGGVVAAPQVIGTPPIVAGPTLVVPPVVRYGYYPYGRPYYPGYGYPHYRRW